MSSSDYMPFVRFDASVETYPGLKASIVNTLEQLWMTPEGKQYIIQAYLLRGGPIVFVSDPTDRNGILFGGHANCIDYPIGKSVVNIDPRVLDRLRYKGVDGNYHEFTINHMIVHELGGHACDNEFVRAPDHCKALHDPAAMRAAEKRAVEVTNRYMQKYYGEVPRGDYDDVLADGSVGTVYYPVNGLGLPAVQIAEDISAGLQHFELHAPLPIRPMPRITGRD